MRAGHTNVQERCGWVQECGGCRTPKNTVDASSIYLCDFRRVAPPKSGEDAHVTHGKCDFGGATLNNPSLGCSYVLPRLWDPGGVSSSANTPRDLSRTIAPSRYPNALLTGYLINLPSL